MATGVPGGLYKHAGGTGYHDANGKPISDADAQKLLAQYGGEETDDAPPSPSPDADAAFWQQTGLTAEQQTALTAAGLTTRERLRAADDQGLLAIPGIGAASLAKLRKALEG